MAVTNPKLWTIRQERSEPTPDAQFEAEQAERKAIFDRIAPAGNWKAPIGANISEADFDDCNQACIWFTGSELTVYEKLGDGRIWVTSPGYYETIGA